MRGQGTRRSSRHASLTVVPHAEPLPYDDARQTACILSHLRLPLHALAYGFWFYCGDIHCGRWQALAALLSMACLVVVEGSAMCFRQPTISFTQRVAFAFDLGVLPGLILVTSLRGLILEAMHPWHEGDSLIIGGFGQTFFTGMVPLDFVLAGVLG